jgi:hypothetical protein
MIKGRVIEHRIPVFKPQVNYRALGDLNVSMLKLFDADPIRFYETFKLGKKRKDKRSTSLLIGDLVDFYLLDCHGDDDVFNYKLDDKFAIFEGERGSGQAYDLADRLFELTNEYPCEEVEDEVMTRERLEEIRDSLFNQAVDLVKADGKYKGKKNTYDKIREDFHNDSDANVYLNALFDNFGKTLVDLGLLDKAKRIATNLMEDEFTRDLFCEGHLERHAKFPIQWVYKTKDCEQECKSEIDLFCIDHDKGIIYLKDLKTTYDNEAFEYAYLKYGYYLQAYFYRLALESWAEQMGMGDYFVTPMEFIVADTSANTRRPVRYELTEDDMKRAGSGFTLKGSYYKGVRQLIDEVCWAESNNIWNCSRNVTEKKGILNLNLYYE